MNPLALAVGVCSTCVLCGALLGSAATAERSNSDVDVAVSAGRIVTVEYTLRLDDQSVLESNVGMEPLTYTQGAHEIVPGLESGMEGMRKGERKTIIVSPADGYGPVDPQAVREVNKELIPPEAQKVGAQLKGQSADGSMVFPLVKEVKPETVVLDFNHPLAGKTLHFDVTVLAISAADLQKQPE